MRFRHSRVLTRARLRASIEKNIEGDKAIARYNERDAPERESSTVKLCRFTKFHPKKIQ